MLYLLSSPLNLPTNWLAEYIYHLRALEYSACGIIMIV